LFRDETSGKYYCILKRDGKQLRASLKTTDPAVAKRKLPAKIRELETVNVDKKTATFADLVKDYQETLQASKGLKPNSLSDENARIKTMVKEWGTKRVREISRSDCDCWVVSRIKKVQPLRVNHEIQVLKVLFRFAIREGYCVENPTDHLQRLKVDKTKIIPPTRHQFQILVDSMRATGNNNGADFVELLAYSGMRQNEAANIVWGEVDFDGGRFWVTGGDEGVKNHQEDSVPLFPALRALLLRIKAQRGHVKLTDRIMNIRGCLEGIANACKQAGLPKFNHHDMRRFFASNAAENPDIDFKTLAGWLRHKDGGILAAQTYSFLRKDHSDELAKKMDFSATDSEGKIVPISIPQTMAKTAC
jgi:integrase